MTSQSDIHIMKQNAAEAALQFIPDEENQIIGIGTGSTTNLFIEALAPYKHRFEGAIASSQATEQALKHVGIPIIELNSVVGIALYFDGADAYNELKQLIKGRGGALAREKILAAASEVFICIVDAEKPSATLGTTAPVPIEVLPMSRSYVAREIVKLGGKPTYRKNFTTDNNNIILDVTGWTINEPIALEQTLNQIPGVVCSGLFASRPADHLIIGDIQNIRTI